MNKLFIPLFFCFIGHSQPPPPSLVSDDLPQYPTQEPVYSSDLAQLRYYLVEIGCVSLDEERGFLVYSHECLKLYLKDLYDPNEQWIFFRANCIVMRKGETTGLIKCCPGADYSYNYFLDNLRGKNINEKLVLEDCPGEL